MSQLVSEGWLEFRTGAGTFVRGDVLDYDLRQLVSFTEQAKSMGKKPTTKVIRFEEKQARSVSGAIRSSLRIGATNKVIYIERLRLADKTPIIFEQRWIVAKHCPKISKISARHSLYSYWTDKCGLEIFGADESIRAVNLNSCHAELLDVLPQTAALLVQSTGYLAGNQPLWHEKTLYRADVYEFRNRLGGLRTSGPAVGRFTDV